MRKRLFAALGLICGVAGCGMTDSRAPVAVTAEFEPPVRLLADGAPVRVEAPGFACPCLADIDHDGKPDLLVGQFNNGQIRVFKNLGGNKFAAGEWLKAEGKTAEVPGVW
jgi:hypothetical protein